MSNGDGNGRKCTQEEINEKLKYLARKNRPNPPLQPRTYFPIEVCMKLQHDSEQRFSMLVHKSDKVGKTLARFLKSYFPKENPSAFVFCRKSTGEVLGDHDVWESINPDVNAQFFVRTTFVAHSKFSTLERNLFHQSIWLFPLACLNRSDSTTPTNRRKSRPSARVYRLHAFLPFAMFSRSQRAETRNRAKDELKRVIMAVDKVRKWEKRWVVLKDTSIHVYKWIPVSGPPTIAPKPQQIKISMDEETNTTASNENSNDETNLLSNTLGEASNFSAGNDDSNSGFPEPGFESDSNQTQTFDRVDYGLDRTTGSTDFSALVREEAERQQDEDSDEPPSKRTKL